MNSRLHTILLRFPKDNDIILKLIRENEDFECLCSDYGECVELLDVISAEPARAGILLEEYLELKIELENEVLRLLKK